MAAALAREDELRVVVGSVVDRPTLLEVDPERPGESAAAQVKPWGTVHASAAYLGNLVRVVVDRAVAQARERAST
jgi:CO/xanthine dehydrogenase FAD-binding subunit